MPLPLLWVLTGLVAGIGAVFFAVLRWDDIVGWFRQRENLKFKDKDHIAFSIQENLANKKYRTVQGIFNKRTNELVDAQKVESNDVSQRQKDLHQDNPLVIYE